MRILFFSDGYTVHDRRFLAKIAEGENEVFFLCLSDCHGEAPTRSLPNGVHQLAWGSNKITLRAPEDLVQLVAPFERILQNVQPDLVHAGPVQRGGFITAMSGFHPFVLMSWGSDILVEADSTELMRWITCYSLRNSTVFLCDCAEVKRRVQQLMDYSEDRIVELPWGTDLDKFFPRTNGSTVRSSLGWGGNFVLLSTRSWEPVYGIDILLQAFELASKSNPVLRLILLGTGSHSNLIQRYIDQKGLAKVIAMPGMIEHHDLKEYFNAADLYISCSSSDGTSVSLLEAMACGLPVVVSDLPCNRQWIKEGENGWLATVRDPRIFASKILNAVSCSVRKQIGLRNRRLAEDRANWDRNSSVLLETYRKLFKGRK